MPQNNWTREETILALALYCKIPFGKIHKDNPQIIDLAQMIGRKPSALSMKMGNFGRFDPELASRGVRGLVHGSKLDETIWNEYYQNMGLLFEEAEKALQSTSILLPESEIELPVGESVPTISTVRKWQAFFRSTVISAYDNTCCITGINIPSLLQASHIKSWKDSNPITERTNPVNGLCLSNLHHKAFDNEIITIDSDYRILISKTAKELYTSEVFNDFFLKYEGKKIRLPNRFLPSKEMIDYHNDHLTGFFS